MPWTSDSLVALLVDRIANCREALTHASRTVKLMQAQIGA
jgi:hypothetical protein